MREGTVMSLMKAAVLAQQDLFMEPEEERIQTALREQARELNQVCLETATELA